MEDSILVSTTMLNVCNQRIYGQKYIKIKLINKNKTQQIILDTFKSFSSQIRRNVLTFIFFKEKNIQNFYKS